MLLSNHVPKYSGILFILGLFFGLLRPVKTVCIKCSGMGFFVRCSVHKMQRVRNNSIYCVLCSELRKSEVGFKFNTIFEHEE